MKPRYFLVIQTAMLIRGYGLSAVNRVYGASFAKRKAY